MIFSGNGELSSYQKFLFESVFNSETRFQAADNLSGSHRSHDYLITAKDGQYCVAPLTETADSVRLKGIQLCSKLNYLAHNKDMTFAVGSDHAFNLQTNTRLDLLTQEQKANDCIVRYLTIE